MKSKQLGVNPDQLKKLTEEHPHTPELEAMSWREYLSNRLDLVKEYQVCTFSWLNSELGKSPGYLANLKKHINASEQVTEKLHQLTGGFIDKQYSTPPAPQDGIKHDQLEALQIKHPNGPQHLKVSEREYLSERLSLLTENNVCTLAWLNRHLEKSSSYLHRLTIKEGGPTGDRSLKISPKTAMTLHEVLNGFVDIHYSMPDLVAPDSDVKLSKLEHERLNAILKKCADELDHRKVA